MQSAREWEVMQSAREWAVMTYGSVKLADQRRSARAITMAEALARHPDGSLPQQMGSQAATKAAYRFLESAQVSYEQLMGPHVQQTRTQMQRQKQILLIQDTTEVDYQHHRATRGLGPIGQGNHQGYLLQTVLAVEPQSKQVLGIAAQEPFLRKPVPSGETSSQRAKRQEKESQVWMRQVQQIGAAPSSCAYIHVGDRGSDMYPFLQECLKQGCGFLVRVQHDRRIDTNVDAGQTAVPAAALRRGKQRASTQEPMAHLFDEVRTWTSRDEQTITLDGNHKRKQREARLHISWGTVRLWPPDELGQDARPLVVTVVRTWEENPPEGEEALQWMLLTSVSVHSVQDAWERVDWYRGRWIVEDYHQGLKTGCQIQARQLQSYQSLRTLLGFLAPLAVRLLQLRGFARQEPERLAQEVLPADVVQVVAQLMKVAPQHLSVRQCWRRIAQAGGFLGRKGDGEPGWKTLWQGWWYIQTLLEGVHLASQLSLE